MEELSDIICISDASVNWPGLEHLERPVLGAEDLFWDARYKLGEYNYASNFHSAPAPEPRATEHAPRSPPARRKSSCCRSRRRWEAHERTLIAWCLAPLQSAAQPRLRVQRDDGRRARDVPGVREEGRRGRESPSSLNGFLAITLTTAEDLRIGAVYVDESPLATGAEGPTCIAPGVYSAQVPGGVEVNLHSPASLKSSRSTGTGSEDRGLSAGNCG